jgi:hypothetical protein
MESKPMVNNIINDTVGISSKFQQQNRRKRDNIDIHVNNTHVHNTHVHDHSLSRLGTVTLIKGTFKITVYNEWCLCYI